MRPHTPTPWALDGENHNNPNSSALQSVYIAKLGDGRVAQTFANCLVTDDECRANAAFIVQACNTHDDLVAELSAAEKIIIALLNEMTTEQKGRAYAKLDAICVSGEGMTRYHERRAVLDKAGAA